VTPAWISISVDDGGCHIVAIAATRDLAEAGMYAHFATLNLSSEGDERTEGEDGTLEFTDDRDIWHGYVIPLMLASEGT